MARWEVIRHGQVIPQSAVIAGTTDTDGIVFVSRHDGEAGKINVKITSTMWNFWGHYNKAQTDAEILVCPKSRCRWIWMRRGDPIPANAIVAGATETDGVNYVARFCGHAGKV